MMRILLTVLSLAAAISVAHADSDSSSPPAFGQVTGDWLRLQASGTQASENAQAASVGAQEKAVKRYLDSFDHPIPEYLYNRSNFSSSGSSSGGAVSH